MLPILLTRRWVTALALALAFAVAAAALGSWQYSRHQEAVADRDRVEAHYDAEPVPLQQVLPAGQAVSSEQDWLRVRAGGSYLPQQQLLVRNRPYRGVYGYEVLVPLRLDTGSVLLVDRGWVANAADASTAPDVPEAPAGQVEVVGWLRPAEPSLDRERLPGQLASINPGEAAEQIGRRPYNGYLVLGEEDAGAGARPERPLPLSAPRTTLGSHFAYALQWWLTAPVGLVMVWVLARREHRERSGDAPPGTAVTSGGGRPRRVRIWDEEDA